ncbi:MAG: ATP-dependent Clp protease proteolytic subunit [Chloroflexi bacterium]|nr:ATP-dependent Clp protease proteolytic subunit [Chloroflexota bacterium]
MSSPVDLEHMLRGYAERRADLDRAGVAFVSEINDVEADRFSKSLLLMAIERRNRRDLPLTIYINSGGGAVGAGLAMIEMMARIRRQYGLVIHTVVTGYAYSMGAILFQAGDRRLMGEFSTLMLHGTQWLLAGEDEKVFKDYLKLANHYQMVIGKLFAQRTGLHDPDWWREFIYNGRDKFLSPQECIELGLVDDVINYEFDKPEPPPRVERP